MLSISDRCGIALRAASLDERLSWYAPRLDRPNEHAAARERLAPADDVLALWQRAFSPGDRESFLRRLAWEGLDLAAVRAAVADEAPPPRTAPAWTSWLLRFSQQAVALGRDLPQLGLPIESGWIAPRDEPPFLELWIPIVRAMRVELTASCRELARALTTPVRHAFERQWLQDIRFWGELAAFEDFRAFEAPSLRDTIAATIASSAGRASTRYDRFIDRHLQNGLASFLQTHALLGRQLATIAQTGVDAARELIVRLDADRDAIAATFNAGRDPGPLVGLDPGLSDPHHGRRRVMRLQFADGLTLIYKPRGVTIERGWNVCLSYLARQGLSSAPPALRVLARDGYGWMAYAAHQPMTSADQVRSYYRRAGSLLCLSWIFGGRDLHAENIVATAHGPVVVDGEMLMQPDGGGLHAPGAAPAAAASAAADAEEESTALDTGLLSLLHRSDDGAMIDIGGLRFPRAKAVRSVSRASASADASRTRRRWVHQRTDDLHFTDVPVEPAPPLANVVRLDGVPVAVETYANDVRDGFGEAYRFALAHVKASIARGDETVLQFFAGGQTRVTFRPSEQYAALSRTLAQPRFQTRGVLRSCALDALNRAFSATPTRPRVWPLVEEERRALERLDLPRFTARVDDRGVMPGGSVGPVYARSGLDAARDRIARLSEADLDRQLTRITAVLRQSVNARFHTPPPALASPAPAPLASQATPSRATSTDAIPSQADSSHAPPLSGSSPTRRSAVAAPAANAVALDGSAVALGPENLRRHAEWIGRELMTPSEPASDQQLTRVGVDRDGRDLSAHALYSGTIGTALFYAALHAVQRDVGAQAVTAGEGGPVTQGAATTYGDRTAHADRGSHGARAHGPSVAHEDTVWADAARGLVDGTRRWLDAIDARDNGRTQRGARRETPHAIGITGGLGSLVYTEVLIAGLLRDPAHLDLAWQAARTITHARIIADTRFDVSDGAAGAAIALIALGRHDPSRAHALDDRLAACGDHLVATQVARATGGAWPARHGGFHVGFAHGAAGIGWALALVHSRLGDDRYRQAALRAFAFVQSQFASAQGNWPVLELDGPAAPLVPTWMQAWCHGAPGIALARALTRRDAPDLAQAIVLTDTHTGTPGTPGTPGASAAAPTDHLCCGVAGQAELQLTLAQLAGLGGAGSSAGPSAGAGVRGGAVPAVAVSGSGVRTAAEAGVKARTLISGMLARARLCGHFRLSASGAEYPILDPGFFSGLSGIGYTLLRMADSRALPSVLAFDTPATHALPIARQTSRGQINAIESIRS